MPSAEIQENVEIVLAAYARFNITRLLVYMSKSEALRAAGLSEYGELSA